MTALRLLAPAALVAALAACVEAPEAAPEAAPAQDAAQTAAPAVQPAAAREEESLNPLEIAARDACAAGDEGFAQILPAGAGFASRGADARVHAAWNLDGERGDAIISTPALVMEDRLIFDGAVADFLRHNMVAGFDREGLTGAFRYRDGRFCVVQTERDLIEALREAVHAAQARIDAGE